jgi:hypothetical protein
MKYLRGLQWNLTDKSQPKDPQGHFVPTGKAIEKLAKQHGVSSKTIQRDAAFAREVDKLPPEEKQAILSGELSRELPKEQGGITRFGSTHDGENQTKLYILKDAGITHHERYETIANIVEENA